MPKIKQALIEKLQSHLVIGKSRVYKLIETKMNETHLDRHLAAIALSHLGTVRHVDRFVCEPVGVGAGVMVVLPDAIRTCQVRLQADVEPQFVRPGNSSVQRPIRRRPGREHVGGNRVVVGPGVGLEPAGVNADPVRVRAAERVKRLPRGCLAVDVWFAVGEARALLRGNARVPATQRFLDRKSVV